ncbi:ImmA/IrrE family metallo-endopeptidase [Streptomyces sp. NPDC090499]|uniref:ImmA/IrrE family metallo-endopeptidase n=1 Tax=Streptomyces sp. NPDC090499 TaxID=3365965 RepID=UPI0037F9C983
MNERQLRRWCKRELRTLGARPPLEVVSLCRLIGDHRGRSIRLFAHRFPTLGPSGLWVATGETDYIFYQQETSTTHQNHIIAHELGHILAEHHGSKLDGELFEGMMPHLSAAAVRNALQRTVYEESEECEAELVAATIMELIWAFDGRNRHPEDSPAHRLGTALGGLQEWI